MKKIIAISCLAVVLLSCAKDDDAPAFALDGLVQNVTERGVRDAEIRIYREGENDPIETFDTEDGEFTVNLAAGDYEIEVEADGYNTYSDDFTIEDDGDEIEVTLEGDAFVSGRVINSQTGTGLLNATVAFSFDGDVDNSDDADLVVTTDANGNFTIDGAPVGEFIQIIESEGYFTRLVEGVEFNDGTNTLANQTLVDQPEQGSIRVILTWGSSPSDLDTHLSGPTSTGTRFHMYYSARTPASSNVSLDVDDVSGFGPETTTITTLRAGNYRYSVHNFSNSTSTGAAGIASSPAVVEIYDFTGLKNRFVAPTAGTGNTWRVFEINVAGTSASVTPINTYVTASSSSDVATFRQDGKNTTYNINDF
jgi:hypothetical protein